MLHPSLMRVFKGCRVLSVMTYFLIYFDCLEKRLFAIHKIESFQRRRKQTERRVESFLFLNAALCMFLTVSLQRLKTHVGCERGGERGRVKVWSRGRRRGPRPVPVCVRSHSWGTGGSGRRRCLCAHVFVWVLQRAAAGHIFPVMGPHSPLDPIWGTFILTSGLWMQPTPSPHPQLCCCSRRTKEIFQKTLSTQQKA